MRWDKIYKNLGKDFTSKLGNWDKFVELLKKNKVQKVLDVGCGSGEHLLSLAKEGFKVWGFDLSFEAIEIAKKTFADAGFEADFKVASMHKKLPYKDNFFDLVYSLRTLNHGRRGNVEFTAKEMHRVLRPGGLMFITVIKILGRKRAIGRTRLNTLPVKIIAPYTYVPLEGKEKGIIHFLFNQRILREIFSQFEVLEVWVDYGQKPWEKYYCLLARKPL
ncbi:MAG: methyltransferase type 11 [Microgenomates bacterium 39_6]|nr:MAG: methyltransferase type 11 [Microgenomates bacterium 39_6]